MKYRNGFVSNSSSQSFIVRGIKINYKQLPKSILEKLPNLKLSKMIFEIDDHLRTKKNDLSCMSTRYYFGGEEKEEVIIGKSLGEMEDGAVFEIPNQPDTDKKIMDELKKIGIETHELSTFVQYISNDNY